MPDKLHRKEIIGGTDISAIAGLNPWRRPIDVYMEKLGLSEPIPDTEPMRWGRELEGVIATRYEEETGRKTFLGELSQHPVEKWMGGTPDRIVPPNSGLEIKTSRTDNGWGPPGTDEIPNHYLAQITWYMLLTEREIWDLAVLIGGSDFRIYTIQYNAKFGDALRTIGREFWFEHVLRQVPPDVDSSESWTEYLKKRYALSKPKLLEEIPIELLQYAQCYNELRESADISNRQAQEYGNRIRAILGEYEGAFAGEWKISWKSQRASSRIDWEAIAKAMNPPSELIAQHTTEKTGIRPLIVKKMKEA